MEKPKNYLEIFFYFEVTNEDEEVQNDQLKLNFDDCDNEVIAALIYEGEVSLMAGDSPENPKTEYKYFCLAHDVHTWEGSLGEVFYIPKKEEFIKYWRFMLLFEDIISWVWKHWKDPV